MAKLKFYIVSNKHPWIYKEVRKIDINREFFRNLANLRQELLSISPGLQDKNFDILWEDQEDTIITIATDEELEIALKDITKKINWEDVYDLYILLSKPDLEAWTSFNYRPIIDSIENVSCEDILSLTAKQTMGNKWMFKLHMVNTENPWLFNEIRKINIDTNVVLNLANLHTKLQTIFPRLQGKNFDVTWRDKECEKCPGIYITIATKKDLALALEEMYLIARKNNKNFYNLYIWLSE